jgi:hypothetical protein
VSGQNPEDDLDLATRKYVDSKIIAPAPVVAGKGLFIDKDGSLAVGAFSGITVNDDDVAVTFADKEDPPQPIGPKPIPGIADKVSHGDHVHTLPLKDEAGLILDDRGLRIEGTVGGEKISFQNPVSGISPSKPEHLATRAYVDENRGKVDAGAGLFLDEGGAISVRPGGGIDVGDDKVSVVFSKLDKPLADSRDGDLGSEPAAARGDHSHPFPVVTPGTVSGLVTFNLSSAQQFTAESDFIDAELEDGTISLQIALVFEQSYYFNADVAMGSPVASVNLGAEVKLGRPTMFKIWAWTEASSPATKPPPLPAVFQVRWFAYRPVREAREITVGGDPILRSATDEKSSDDLKGR